MAPPEPSEGKENQRPKEKQCNRKVGRLMKRQSKMFVSTWEGNGEGNRINAGYRLRQ